MVPFRFMDMMLCRLHVLQRRDAMSGSHRAASLR